MLHHTAHTLSANRKQQPSEQQPARLVSLERRNFSFLASKPASDSFCTVGLPSAGFCIQPYSSCMSALSPRLTQTHTWDESSCIPSPSLLPTCSPSHWAKFPIATKSTGCSQTQRLATNMICDLPEPSLPVFSLGTSPTEMTFTSFQCLFFPLAPWGTFVSNHNLHFGK